MPDGTYVLGMLHGKPVVGMMDMADAPQFKDIPPHWFSYFAVDDVDAEVARTREMGGTVIRRTVRGAGNRPRRRSCRTRPAPRWD